MAGLSFGTSLMANRYHAYAWAQMLADVCESPCGVWHRDGWYTVCAIAPELIEPNPEDDGWTLDGLATPQEDSTTVLDDNDE